MPHASPSTLLFTLAAAAALAGAVGLAVLWWYQRRTGFRLTRAAGTEILASDTGVAPAVLLRDPMLGLRGRPDYVLAEKDGDRRRLVPFELKPARRSRRLYESDAVQLGVYLLLLGSTYGEDAARFGYVRYATGTFRVELTAALEQRVREIASAIRAGRRAAVVHRSHAIAARCARCAFRASCDEALG
jgi:CRISPR/Cas system-associated exonuclease Cas4 (RecB family)